MWLLNNLDHLGMSKVEKSCKGSHTKASGFEGQTREIYKNYIFKILKIQLCTFRPYM